MFRFLLINPNTSDATTALMLDVARSSLEGGEIIGVTARRGPSMITQEKDLATAAANVIEMGLSTSNDFSGIIIAAFGDPGINELRNTLAIPVVGISEASMHAAAMGGRRFGIATVTPGLVANIESRVRTLGLSDLYTGTRLTFGNPIELSSNPRLLEIALADVVEVCLNVDSAQAVVIGGGPLSAAALSLALHFKAPIISPVSAAIQQLIELVSRRSVGKSNDCPDYHQPL